jgi:hypothetical protein
MHVHPAMATEPTRHEPPGTTAKPPALRATSTRSGPDAAAVLASPAPGSFGARVMARREDIIAKLVELRNDARPEAAETRDSGKAKLSSLAHLIKHRVVDWATITEVTKDELDDWLADSFRGFEGWQP